MNFPQYKENQEEKTMSVLITIENGIRLLLKIFDKLFYLGQFWVTLVQAFYQAAIKTVQTLKNTETSKLCLCILSSNLCKFLHFAAISFVKAKKACAKKYMEFRLCKLFVFFWVRDTTIADKV